MSYEDNKRDGYKDTQKDLRDNPPKSVSEIADRRTTNEASKTVTNFLFLGFGDTGYQEGAEAALKQAQDNM